MNQLNDIVVVDEVVGMNMAHSSRQESMNLYKLVHLALDSSPRLAVVNFNLLKTFLLELLKALNLQQHEFKLNGHESEDAIRHEKTKYRVATSSGGIGDSSGSVADGENVLNTFISSVKQPLTAERFQRVEDKISRLEQQIASLNELPNNQHLIEKTKEMSSGSHHHFSSASHTASGGFGSTKSSGPIVEAWQYTQLSKRLESNEDGLTRLTSLMQDLIGEMNELKETQAKSAGEMDMLNRANERLSKRMEAFEELKKNMPTLEHLRELDAKIEWMKQNMLNEAEFKEKLKELENQLLLIEGRLAHMVTHPDLELYVTWTSLENSIKGLKEEIDTAMHTSSSQQKPLPPVVSSAGAARMSSATVSSATILQPSAAADRILLDDFHRSSQTTPTLAAALRKSRPGSALPTEEFKDILYKLGTLNDRHEDLKSLVNQLKAELEAMGKRASNNEGMGDGLFKLPDDFAQRLDEIKLLKAALEELMRNFKNETNKRSHFEALIDNLNKELDRIRSSISECLRSTQLNKDEIQSLKEALRLLDEAKADKEWTKSELERKADKRDLDQRVHKKTFEDTCLSLSNSVNNCVQKSTTLEDEFHKSNDHLLKELENKLDRLELDSIKDLLEKQMKKFKKIQQKETPIPTAQPANTTIISELDEAAGLRKQLLRFHCISCDRPIELNSSQNIVPSLPAERGLRPIQTPRPYSVYELDQIRQMQRHQYMNDHGQDLFATMRQCGGQHTLTLPHKKLPKMVPTSVVSDEPPVSQIIGTHKNEVQIQGVDGNIYKGRLNARFPSVELKATKLNKNITSFIHPKSANHNHNNNNNNGIDSFGATSHLQMNHHLMQPVRPNSSYNNRTAQLMLYQQVPQQKHTQFQQYEQQQQEQELEQQQQDPHNNIEPMHDQSHHVAIDQVLQQMSDEAAANMNEQLDNSVNNNPNNTNHNNANSHELPIMNN